MPDHSKVDSDGEQIPLLLRSAKRWCCWQLKPNPGGRPTKVPDQSTLDVSRCRSWEEVGSRQRWSEGGIGFVTTGRLQVKLSDGTHATLLFVDLDGCRAQSGEVRPWAISVIEMLGNSYTEVSPSGFGLRIPVLVRKPPENVRAKVDVPAPAATGCTKKPQLQLFGLLPAGYVTMTGERLAATSREVLVVDDLEHLVTAFGMHEDAVREGKVRELIGDGPEPTLDAITAQIADTENGRALIAGDWKKVMPDKSASEAFFVLAQMALAAANGHGDAVLDWLMTRTAWGRGEIDDSMDPGKYGRTRWVEQELLRVAARAPRVNAAELFPVLPPLPSSNGVHAGPELRPKNTGVDLLALLKQEGPIVHLPTGIQQLDNMTGGGLVLGSRAYLIGAPNAGKTLLAVQLVDSLLQRGIPVAILGVDEEPSDIGMRLMQRRGISRVDIEQRTPEVLAMAAALGEVPLLLFDSTTSIESAAVQLHALAKRRQPDEERPPCVLMIDSVQTALAEADDDNDSLYKTVTHRVRKIRAAASRYRMLIITTSEMSRAAYRSKKQDEQARDMAAAKESGAIEFSARVLLSLRNVPTESNVVELRVVKNKHGPEHRDDQDGIFLRVDRDSQQLIEDEGFVPVDPKEEAVAERMDSRTVLAGKLAALVLLDPSTGRNSAAAAFGVSTRTIDEIAGWLRECGALTVKPVKRGQSQPYILIADKLPKEVAAAMQLALTQL